MSLLLIQFVLKKNTNVIEPYADKLIYELLIVKVLKTVKRNATKKYYPFQFINFIFEKAHS